jgi:hypothetical protein
VGRGVLAVRQSTFRSLARYVGLMAAELGLRDWEIVVMDDEPADQSAIASVECIYGRRLAHVRFRSDFAHLPAPEQRAAVLHELLHVHLSATDQAVRDHISEMGVEARGIAESTYSTAREHAVDAIAAAISHRFPTWRV